VAYQTLLGQYDLHVYSWGPLLEEVEFRAFITFIVPISIDFHQNLLSICCVLGLFRPNGHVCGLAPLGVVGLGCREGSLTLSPTIEAGNKAGPAMGRGWHAGQQVTASRSGW
jgi:hypothetical protein